MGSERPAQRAKQPCQNKLTAVRNAREVQALRTGWLPSLPVALEEM